jgi:hypothetical protein
LLEADPVRFLAALRTERAKHVDRLRRQADMRHHRHAAFDQETNRLRHARAAFDLDGAAARFFEHARSIHEGLFLRALVGTERHVDDDQRALTATHHRVALQNHHFERDGNRGL